MKITNEMLRVGKPSLSLSILWSICNQPVLGFNNYLTNYNQLGEVKLLSQICSRSGVHAWFRWDLCLDSYKAEFKVRIRAEFSSGGSTEDGPLPSFLRTWWNLFPVALGFIAASFFKASNGEVEKEKEKRRETRRCLLIRE